MNGKSLKNGTASQGVLENIKKHPIENIDISRHTDDIQEIMTKPPAWILRWGITIFFATLLMLLGLSVLIKYPDTMKVNLTIQSNEEPVIITTPFAGRISNVFVKTGAIIKAGQVLADIEKANGRTDVSVVTAPSAGKIFFVSIIEKGGFLAANQPLFKIHPENEQFYGIIEIPKANIDKIKKGQRVIVNLKNFPPAEYGQLGGKISYISDEPGTNGLFIAKVGFDEHFRNLKKTVQLKSWMAGTANIITQDLTVFNRISRNVIKAVP